MAPLRHASHAGWTTGRNYDDMYSQQDSLDGRGPILPTRTQVDFFPGAEHRAQAWPDPVTSLATDRIRGGGVTVAHRKDDTQSPKAAQASLGSTPRTVDRPHRTKAAVDAAQCWIAPGEGRRSPKGSRIHCPERIRCWSSSARSRRRRRSHSR